MIWLGLDVSEQHGENTVLPLERFCCLWSALFITTHIKKTPFHGDNRLKAGSQAFFVLYP
jgi:hypothetical protein